ncbi:MAG: hypothetical protein ACKV1O_10125 [Saprospiraceae bacterium]
MAATNDAIVEQLFEKVKKETLLQMAQKVRLLDNKSLDCGDVTVKLWNEFQIQAPKLQTFKINVTIGEEPISARKVSNGSPPGETVYFACYTVPLEGSYLLFVQLLKRHAQSDCFHHRVGKACFKEKSLLPIIGHTPVIESIKSKAEIRILEIEELLGGFYTKAENFNACELEVEIQRELNDRLKKKETEEALNPFL